MIGFQSWKQALNATLIASTPLSDLQSVVRTSYRSIFKHAIATGTAKPAFLSIFLLAPALLTLWLSVPHARGGGGDGNTTWFYETRWLVIAAAVGLNVYHLLYVSSTSLMCTYVTGFTSTYFTLLTLQLLVWTRPQLDSARVIKVTKEEGGALRRRYRVDGVVKGRGDDAHQNDDVSGTSPRKRKGTTGRPSANQRIDDEGNGEQQEEQYEFVWQPFPADGTFSERFGWSFDLLICIRGTGWSHAISVLPRPALPQEIHHGDLVDMDSIPRVSRASFSRCLTEAEFLRDRWRKILTSFCLLDFFSVAAMKDPYNILGPDFVNGYALPPVLAWMPPRLLHAYRQALVFLAILNAFRGLSSVGDLVCYWLAKRLSPSRAFVWQHASTFGSFTQVLDRGQAGFWGSFWHQTFRLQFQGPVTYLLRKGYLEKRTMLTSVVSALVAFTLSGILHASGSISSMPPTKPSRSIVFFMSQAVTIFIQVGAARIIQSLFFSRGQSPPKLLCRITNFLYACACLYFTAPLFSDDMSSCAIIMFEPVPISPLRYFGFGQPGDKWWRWDRESFPLWYSSVGGHWWQTGLAI